MDLLTRNGTAAADVLSWNQMASLVEEGVGGSAMPCAPCRLPAHEEKDPPLDESSWRSTPHGACPLLVAHENGRQTES
jgi:hypothetical protein